MKPDNSRPPPGAPATPAPMPSLEDMQKAVAILERRLAVAPANEAATASSLSYVETLAKAGCVLGVAFLKTLIVELTPQPSEKDDYAGEGHSCGGVKPGRGS